VVQDNIYNQIIADTVLVLVSRTARAPGATETEIDPAVETQSGLRYLSVASCTNLLTIDRGLICANAGKTILDSHAADRHVPEDGPGATLKLTGRGTPVWLRMIAGRPALNLAS
jgi:hypothetical protein